MCFQKLQAYANIIIKMTRPLFGTIILNIFTIQCGKYTFDNLLFAWDPFLYFVRQYYLKTLLYIYPIPVLKMEKPSPSDPPKSVSIKTWANCHHWNSYESKTVITSHSNKSCFTQSLNGRKRSQLSAEI